MAASKRRWNLGLFPIDDTLIEQLIDEYRRGAEESDAADDDPLQAVAHNDADAVLYFVDDACATPEDDDDLLESRATDFVSDDDVHAVNMRVLDDYLRRRLIEPPAPAAPTLH